MDKWFLNNFIFDPGDPWGRHLPFCLGVAFATHSTLNATPTQWFLTETCCLISSMSRIRNLPANKTKKSNETIERKLEENKSNETIRERTHKRKNYFLLVEVSAG